MIRQAVISRRPSSHDGTLGEMEVQDVEVPLVPHLVKLFKTMERPATGDHPDIASGQYLCKYTRSNRLSAMHGYDFYTYEVMDVPGRTGIRIHSANVASQLQGCIALGERVGNFNGVPGVEDSREAVSDFEHLMNHEDFYLTILEAA